MDIFVLTILKVILTLDLNIKVAIASRISTEKAISDSFQFKESITIIIPSIINMSPKIVTIPEDSISFRV
ncbi:unnamed protein product [marine sediment metagenome]|uniref:Uncharacterized protein n=2 Tax=marine sediment metagenome TaxID=412755 RepID=X1JEP5_9ZZZZ